jgi:serine/threonine protein kinase
MKKRLPLSKGTILQSRYRILRQLGHGGMGAVYEAADGHFRNRSVALKETYADSDETYRAFQREAQLLANTEHEAFPRVIDYFTEEEGYFLVMELIRGRDLTDLLHEQVEPFEQSQVLDWADQLLDALDDLHSNRIIHRDIKPSNLKLTPKGRLKLLDFGIAKSACEGDKSKFTTVGSLAAATFEYAPLEQVVKANIDWFSALSVNYPEQTAAVLQRSTDAPSDLYALSATLYQLLTKHLPVNAPTRAMAIWGGQKDKMRPAHELNPKVSPLVSEFLQKGLELDRKERFPSAREMREALRNLVSVLQGTSIISKEAEQKLIPKTQVLIPICEPGNDRHSIKIPVNLNLEQNKKAEENLLLNEHSESVSVVKLKQDKKSLLKNAAASFRNRIIFPLNSKIQKTITGIRPKIQFRRQTSIIRAARPMSESRLKSVVKNGFLVRKQKRIEIDLSRKELKFEPKLLSQHEAFRNKSHLLMTIWATAGVVTVMGVVIGTATFQPVPHTEAKREEIKDSIRPDAKITTQIPAMTTKPKNLTTSNTAQPNLIRKTNSSSPKVSEQPSKTDVVMPVEPPQSPAVNDTQIPRRVSNKKNGKPKNAHNSDCIFSGKC